MNQDSSQPMPASMPMSRKLNQLLLSLHREGRELQLHSFQKWALERVCSLIPFDSAWWGNAALAHGKIQRSYLFNCDDSIIAAYPRCRAHDFFSAALVASPGTSINLADLTTHEQFVRTGLYRHVGKPYRIAWSLGTLLNDTVSSLCEFLTLWRHDSEHPFTEAERQAKELLMPHLMEAFRAARLRHFLRDKCAWQRAWALADSHGIIRETSTAFDTRLRDHWPDWQGRVLPEALARCVVQGDAYETKYLAIDVRQSENLRFLEVRPKSLFDRLTGREGEIIGRYANGETYSTIAAVLSLSPATVRNHISNCFRKLGVRNKAELAQRLNPAARAAQAPSGLKP